jgi:hypothetical protein
MKRELLSLVDLQNVTLRLFQIADPELRVLKTHLVIEQMLIMLLAMRLGIDEKQVPSSVTFSSLAELALSGERYATERGKARALNELRNVFGHQVTASIVSDGTEKFLSAFGFVYLPITKLADQALNAACQRIASEIWTCVTEKAVELAPVGTDTTTLRAAIVDTRREFAEADKQLAANRKVMKPFPT